MSGTEVPTVLAVAGPTLGGRHLEWLEDAYRTRVARDATEVWDRLDGDVDVVLVDGRLSAASDHAISRAIMSRGLDCRVALVAESEPEFDAFSQGFDDVVVATAHHGSIRSTVESLYARIRFQEKVQESFALTMLLSGARSDTDDPAIRDVVDEEVINQRLWEIDEEINDLLSALREHDGYEGLFYDLGRRADFEEGARPRRVTV